MLLNSHWTLAETVHLLRCRSVNMPRLVAWQVDGPEQSYEYSVSVRADRVEPWLVLILPALSHRA